MRDREAATMRECHLGILIFQGRKTFEMNCYAAFFQQVSIPFFMKGLNLLKTSTHLDD